MPAFIEEVLRHLPSVEVDQDGRTAVVHGRPVADRRADGQPVGSPVALVDGSELLAIAEAGDGWLRPTVVLGSQ